MKWIQSILLYITVTISVTYIMLTISSLRVPTVVWTGKELFEELVIAIILGIVIGIATRILEIEQISHRLLVFIHFMIVTAGVFIAGAIGNWYDFKNITSVLLVFVVILIVYVIIWGVVSTLERREIERVNQLLKGKRETDDQYY